MRVYDRESQASFPKQVSDYDLLNGKKNDLCRNRNPSLMWMPRKVIYILFHFHTWWLLLVIISTEWNITMNSTLRMDLL